MRFLQNTTIQVIVSYAVIVSIILILLYTIPRYIGWVKVYFTKVQIHIDRITPPIPLSIKNLKEG